MARVSLVARSLGTVLAYYLVVVALGLALSLLVPASLAQTNPILARSACVVVAALAVGTVLSRLTEWDWGAQGWPGGRAAFIGFDAGLVGGLALAAVVVVGALVFGARVRFTGVSVGAIALAAVPLLAGLFSAALAEELLFRGFPLARLSADLGKLPAALTLAVTFALLHWGNPGISLLAILNIALAGIALSGAFFGPGGLATAWGLHFGWNAGLGLVFEAPVSGVSFQMPHASFATGGPALLTGGGFGPEGGLVATVGFAVLVGAWHTRFRSGNGEPGAGKGNTTALTVPPSPFPVPR